jgi:hypothetical protein
MHKKLAHCILSIGVVALQGSVCAAIKTAQMAEMQKAA